jgi:hypothetical protein
MKLKTAFPLAALAALTGCTSKIIVTRVPTTGTPRAMEGVYYALPKTVVKVDQPIDRVAQQPGKYVVYLPLFFPKLAEAGSAVKTAKVSFKVNKASISTSGEPDPAQIFYLKTTGNGAIDRTGLIEYSEQGTVSGASAQADNATSDMVLSVLSTAAGLAAKSFGAGDIGTEDPCRQKAIPKRILAVDTPGSSVDSQRLIATYCSMDEEVRKPIDEAAKANKPHFDDALAAYAQIFALQEARTTVRNSPSALAVEAALKDFDSSLATALADNFIGSEKKDTWTFSTELRDFELGQSAQLLKVHPTKGLCSFNPLPAGDRPAKNFWFESAGFLCDEAKIRSALEKQLSEAKQSADAEEIRKKIEKLSDNLKGAELFAAEFALNPTTNQPFQILANARQSGERGFYYRIPASTDVVLKLGEDVVTRSRQSIAQFGTVASLPASAGGKSTAYALKFYEATGALKSFNVTSKAVLTKGTADTVGSAVATVVTAKQTANDVLTALDHQNKVMAARKAIYDNCKALNMACGGYVPTPATPAP